MDCLIGIDIGSTGAKSAMFSADGALLDIEFRPYPIDYPEANRAEQDPNLWWNALAGTVRAIVERKPRGNDIVAMCLSTQGGCLLLVDQDFRPLCNAVHWLDKRAGEVSGLLAEKVGAEELYRTCGWSVMDGLNFPAAFWFREKRPELFEKARYFCSTVDYLNYRLTGVFSIDYTNLAMTQFLDLNARDWSDKNLHLAGITRAHVPEIIPSGAVISKLSPRAAEELGLTDEVVLVSGAHDQYCASLGAGAVKAGNCVLSAGTAWVLAATSDRLLFDNKRTVHPCLHLVEKKYGLLTSVPSGGNSLCRFRSTFTPEWSYERLSLEAGKAGPGSMGLVFIPNDVSASGKGAFLNIDTAHETAHFVRAVLEGVAYANRQRLEAFAGVGMDIEKLIMIGGGAKSSLWPRIVADVSGIPVVIQDQKDAACAGAAILAGAGSGVFSSLEHAAGLFSREKMTVSPKEKNVAAYDKGYTLFIECLEV